MTAADFISKLGAAGKPRPQGSGWVACCPAHEDRNPSLSIQESGDKLLLHCQAGCETEAVCAAMGIKLADLFNGEPKRNGKGRIVATYDYADEAGKLLFQVLRYEQKVFSQRQPDGNGGWNWKMAGVRRVLFGLPKLIEGINAGFPVFICEGEKDCLALQRHGLTATCNAGGAESKAGSKKWLPEYTETLRGADACIIADKDETGRTHARVVANHLHGVAKTLRVLELPDVGGRTVKDAHDYIEAGGEAGGILTMAGEAPLWTPETSEAEIHENGDALPADELYFAQLIEDAADIVLEDLPPPVEIVAGLVTDQSKLVIGSGSKSFKTWVTINLALAIAHGKKFWGRETTKTRVLYVNLELKGSTFKRRVKLLADTMGIKVDPGWFLHLPLRGKIAGLTIDVLMDRIIKLAMAKQCHVVVLDPVYKLNTAGDENSARDMANLFNQLDRLTTEAEATVILNDHFGKGNQSEKDPLDAIRGSSAKGGDVDAAMVLRRHEVAECFRVDVIHRELAPVEPFVVGWEFPLMALRDDLDPEAMKKLKGGRAKEHDPLKLLEFIAASTDKNPVSISEWAEAADIKRRTLSGYCGGFRQQGFIATAGEGTKSRQFITTKGLSAIRRTQ